MTNTSQKLLLAVVTLASILGALLVVSLVPRSFVIVTENTGNDAWRPGLGHLYGLEKPVLVGARIVTAYTLGREKENDADPCVGAYGLNLCDLARQGVVICASREFEKGILLRVGEIECVVLDKTNARYQYLVDVAMPRYEDARTFGRKILSVYLIGRFK